MSELPGLPDRPELTRPIPPAGLDAVMTAGRRRRNRALTAAGGGGAALALMLTALIVLPNGQRDDSLQQIANTPMPAPSSGTSAELVPTPDAEPAGRPSPTPGSGRPLPGSGPLAPVPSTPAAADRPRSGATPVPVTEPSPSLAGAAPRSEDARPAYLEDTDEDADGALDCLAGSAAAGGCTYTSGGNEVVRRGEQAQVILGYCSPENDAGDRVYSFAGGQEKDVLVQPEDNLSQETYRFSSTVRYVEGAHERRLRRGRCIQWTGRWDLVTTQGNPVPAGDYVVTLRVGPAREVYEGGFPEETELDETISVRFTVVG